MPTIERVQSHQRDGSQWASTALQGWIEYDDFGVLDIEPSRKVQELLCDLRDGDTVGMPEVVLLAVGINAAEIDEYIEIGTQDSQVRGPLIEHGLLGNYVNLEVLV